MSEKSIIAPEEKSEPVKARDLFKPYGEFLEEFKAKIDDGEIEIIETNSDFEVNAGTFFLTRHDTSKIDSAIHGTIYNWHDSLDKKTYSLGCDEFGAVGFDDNQLKEVGAMIHDKEIEAILGVAIVMGPKNVWWLNQNNTDSEPWLSNVTVKRMYELCINDRPLVITVFSDDFVPDDAFLDGIKEVADKLAGHGLDLTDSLRWINIVDSKDYQKFQLPKEVIDKFPTAYVAAQANKSKRLMTFNSRVFSKKEKAAVIKRATVSEDWKGTMIHEIGHLFNMGLIDGSDRSYARDLGWRHRNRIIIDDYGNLIDDEDKGGLDLYTDDTTDDFGNIVRVGSTISQQMLVQAGIDNEGKSITPPSWYGNTNSQEDIAESFDAYFMGLPLDGLRKAVIERLIEKNRTAHEALQVDVREINPAQFDIWNYLKKEYRVLPPSFHISP